MVGIVLGRQPLCKEPPAKSKGKPYCHLDRTVHCQLKSVGVLVEADPQEDAKPAKKIWSGDPEQGEGG